MKINLYTPLETEETRAIYTLRRGKEHGYEQIKT
jgi:hypothetical protein